MYVNELLQFSAKMCKETIRVPFKWEWDHLQQLKDHLGAQLFCASTFGPWCSSPSCAEVWGTLARQMAKVSLRHRLIQVNRTRDKRCQARSEDPSIRRLGWPPGQLRSQPHIPQWQLLGPGWRLLALADWHGKIETPELRTASRTFRLDQFAYHIGMQPIARFSGQGPTVAPTNKSTNRVTWKMYAKQVDMPSFRHTWCNTWFGSQKNHTKKSQLHIADLTSCRIECCVMQLLHIASTTRAASETWNKERQNIIQWRLNANFYILGMVNLSYRAEKVIDTSNNFTCKVVITPIKQSNP